MVDFLESALGALGSMGVNGDGSYMPVSMSDSQLRQESGGNQVTRTGKPVTSSAGAIGVAQVMPKTAKAMAEDLGIPWDENKYKYDRDYNLKLGDHYQTQLNAQFGAGTTEALAAYNAGPGNGRDGKGVLGAKQRAAAAGRPGDWFSFLPQETQDYVTKIRGGSTGTGGGFTVPTVLTDPGRTSGSGTVTSRVWNPNEAAGTISDDFDRSRSRAVAADDVLSQTVEAIGNVQQNESRALADRNNRTQAILDEQQERTQGAMERMAPLFAQRRAVADQKVKLEGMNPLVRGIKSLFDQNYDKSHLDEVGGAIDDELKTNTEEYNTMLGLQDTMLKIVQQGYEGVSMQNQLETQHLDQNLSLATKSLAAGNAIWETDLQGLDSDAKLRSAQLQMTDQVLSELTPGQVGTYLEAAKKSPNGNIQINGANVSGGQLLQQSQRWGEQQVQVEQMKVNIAAGNQSLADHTAERLISNMTTGQIRNAINNNGMFQGVQLPLDRLGAGLTSSMNRDANMVQGTMTQGSVDTFNYMRHSIAQTSQIAGIRATQMTGSMPSVLQDTITRQNPEVGQMMQKIQAAPPDQREMVAQAYLPRIQQMAKERAEALDQVATKWAGNNKDLKPLATAFLSGQPLNTADSAKGIISLVRTGGSFGAQMSPEANAAINAAKRVIAQSDAKARGAGNDPATMFMKPQAMKEREEQLVRDVSSAIGQTYGNAQFDSIVHSAPTIAKQIGHIGQNLDPVILSQAINAGDEEGYRRLAVQLKMTPAQAKQVFAAGQHPELAGQLAMQQSMATSQYLNAHHPKIGGHMAGAVFANLLNNPRFVDIAGKLSARQAQMGFGDYVVGSLGASDQVSRIGQYGKVVNQGYTQLITNTRMDAAAAANRYNDDPMRRTAAILGAMPGLEQNDEQMLLKAIAPIYQAASSKRPGPAEALTMSADMTGAYSPNTLGFDAIRQAIVNHKFQDPVLEKIRMKVAKDFDTYANVTDKAFDRYGNYSPEQQ